MMKTRWQLWRENCHDEKGQTAVFVIGLMAILLLLGLVILAVTTVNLEARRLLSAADSASSAAARTFVVKHNEGKLLTLDASRVATDVKNHLQQSGATDRFTDLQIEAVSVNSQGDTLYVRLTARAQPPVINWIIPDAVTVVAESSARTTTDR